jgi:HlyD family secretion protein
MKKLALILLVLLGGLGAWAFASRGTGESGDSAQRYRTEPAGRGPIVASVSATGVVNATTTVIVGSQLSGQVVEILADHNSEVKAGQLMARLNRDTLMARRDAANSDLMQARATRRLNDAQAEKVKADIQRAEAQQQDMRAQLRRITALAADAEATYERQLNLKQRGIATDVAFQAAQTARETQIAAQLSADAQLAGTIGQIAGLMADARVVEAQKAGSDAQIAKAEAVLRQIDVDLANSEIRSPVDGVVVQRNVELGQTVAASLQAPTLFLVAQDLRRVEIHVNLDEADVGRVKAGQQVEFSVNAYTARNFTGSVKLVRLGSQTVQNVVIYTTVVEVPNDDMALLPGMTANVRIFTERKADVLRVPNSALRWQPAGAPRAAGPGGPPGGPQEQAQSGDDPAGPFADRPQGAGPGAGNPQRQIQMLVESLKTDLKLSPDQGREVEKLATQMREAIAKAGNDQTARREAARAERQRFNRAVDAILTSEQREKYREWRQARQQNNPNARNTQAGVPGRVHVVDEKGNPRAISVRVGATDGTFSEILSGEVKPSDALIVGVATPARARSSSTFRFGL